MLNIRVQGIPPHNLNNNNTDIVALKSNNALGTKFWVTTQRKYKNHGYSDDYSGFVIVATENGTIVNIDPKGNNLLYHGTTPFSVTLDKGQAIAIRAAGQAPAQHIAGVRVTTTNNKKIAITVFDDSMQITDGGGSWDLFADQLVPEELVGYEYIVMKGNIQDNNDATNPFDGEAIFITPTMDNTDIYINGALVATNIPAGGYFEYVIKVHPTHVRATNPVYLNHISGWQSPSVSPFVGRELGGAILPTIDGCTGSHSVTLKKTPATNFYYYINIMVRNDTAVGSPTRNQAIHHFTYSINNGPPIALNPDHFTYIMDSAFAIYDRDKAGGGAFYNTINDGDVVRVENDLARFHLGVMQGRASPGSKYGYFSDYAESGASAGIGGFTQPPSDVFCSLNPIRLVAGGGTAYQWTTPLDPLLINQLDYDTVAAPYFFPDTSGYYYFNVIVTGECFTTQTLEIDVLVLAGTASNFTFSSDVGCSPFAPIMTNNSDTVIGTSQIWTIETAASGTYQIDQDTIPRTYPLLLPENHTDTIQKHTVTLIVKNGNDCPTEKTKVISVKPQVNSDFTLDENSGCHPHTVNFTNLSTGHLDSTSYTWYFGDNSQSFLLDPVNTYENYGLNDTSYTVQLEVESPLGCTDISSDTITVHPRVRAAMAINTSMSCSPLNIIIDPANSIGVDTFLWHINSPTADTTYITQIKAPVSLYHQDITYASPDTIYVDLVGMNRMGCTDSFPQRNIIVFPEVNAGFEIINDSICDADSITFANISNGFELFYNWDFDDGTVYQDTTGTDYVHAFYNRSDKDSSYRVTLTATSGYLCESIFDTLILVHPYIKANFGMDYLNNCTPILANFSNLSIRGHDFEWDFGDGENSTTADPSFTHQYWNNSATNDTTYYISLVALNNEGCSDTMVRALDIFPHVVADFSLTDSVGCSPLGVSFVNSSSGGLLSYLWDFGNGTTSTNPNPAGRSYTNFTDNDTSYIISLTAVNPYGCDSTTFDTVDVFSFIDADFNLPRADSCSPFILHPDNLSSPGAHFFEWDLLNSALPTITDPVPEFDTLTNYGFYTDTLYLRLIAYGAADPEHYACADRDSVMIKVYPELDVDFDLDVTASCQPLESDINNATNIFSGTLFQWFVDSTFYSAQPNPPDLNIPNLEDTDADHVIYLAGTSKYGCFGEHSETVTVYSLVDAKFTIIFLGRRCQRQQ